MVVVVVVWLVAMLALAVGGCRLRRWILAAATRVRVVRRRPPAPAGRPIEAIARDAHRLSLLYHYPRPGLSFAQAEGRRRAYDAVLAEACRALDVPHLLGVLPPGPEHDHERERVELLLDWAGLRLDDAA